MPIPFSLIPEHIRTSIVQKLYIWDFWNFHQCSLESYDISQKIKTRFVVHKEYLKFCQYNEEISFQFIIGDDVCHSVRSEILLHLPVTFYCDYLEILTSFTENCSKLLCFCLMSASYIYIHKSITCSSQKFNDFFGVARPKRLVIDCEVPSEFLRLPMIQKIGSIKCRSTADDSDFLSLRIPYLWIQSTNISSVGINRVLKEWFNGQRELNRVTLHTSCELSIENVLEGFKYSNLRTISQGKVYCLKKNENEEMYVFLKNGYFRFDKDLDLCEMLMNFI